MTRFGKYRCLFLPRGMVGSPIGRLSCFVGRCVFLVLLFSALVLFLQVCDRSIYVQAKKHCLTLALQVCEWSIYVQAVIHCIIYVQAVMHCTIYV